MPRSARSRLATAHGSRGPCTTGTAQEHPTSHRCRGRFGCVSAEAGSTMELEAYMANVSVARRFVRTELEGFAPDAAVSDLMLATSELVTNAFEHGAAAPVRLTVRRGHDQASVTVTSGEESRHVPALDRWITAGADRISGRGLGIVREIADDIDVERNGHSVAITVRRNFFDI